MISHHITAYRCVAVLKPLSFLLIAGYNNVEVAEYLLEHGADVNARDKGGLIPLHNASSYGVSESAFTMPQ